MIAHRLSWIAIALSLSACPPAKTVRNAATVTAGDLPNTVTDLNRYADEKYKEQTADAMENSLVALDKALALEKSYESSWRAARASGWLTDEFPDRRAAYAERGQKYADDAIAADPKRVEGQYYLGINLGQLARAKGLGGGRALVPKVLAAGKAAVAIDPKFDFGGPLRLVGSLYAQAPEPPSSIGDVEEGLKYLKQALDAAGGYPLNHLLYGDALLKNRDFDAADREYNTVLQAQPQPEWASRLARWQKDAQTGLVHVRNKRRGDKEGGGL